MTTNEDRFSPEENRNKINPIGKILASAAFGALGIVLIVLVFAQYRNIWVPTLIVLAIGFILVSIWNKNFYIYRYMLPAILILLVFTAYPIVYTIYIAFTNFGTGHMQTKEEARNIVINTKWTVDYSSQPLFAEFYAPEKEIREYMKAYKKAFEEFDSKMFQERKRGRSDEFIETKWESEFYGSKQPELVKNYLSKLEKRDFTVVFYTVRNVDFKIPESVEVKTFKNEILDKIKDTNIKESIQSFYTLSDDKSKYNLKSDLTWQTKRDIYEKLKTAEFSSLNEVNNNPIKVYLSDKGSRDLKEIDLDSVDSLVEGKMLIGSPVFARPTLKDKNMIAEEDIDEDNSIMVSVEDFQDYYVGIKDKAPFKFESSEYLLDNANQFFCKRHTYKYAKKEESNQIYHLNEDTYQYDRKVFEDNKLGAYVVTTDEKPPRYWNEYKLTSLEYDYGALTLEKSSDAENYLDAKILEEDIEAKLIFTKNDMVEGKPIDKVNKEDLSELKKEVSKANKYIMAFNKKISKYKQDYIKLTTEKIKNELPDLPTSFDRTIFKTKILSKIQNEEQKKMVLFYYRVGMGESKTYNLEADKVNDEAKKSLWTIFASTNYFDIKKEQSSRISKLYSTKFPKLSLIKVEKSINANIDRSIQIEPGYSVWVGMNNFKRIVSSRNITAPFLFVFIWTIIWSAVSVISSFAMGLALALVFNASDFKGKYIYRTLFILPYAIPAFVSVLMWNGFLNKDFGVINNLLKGVFQMSENIPWTMEGTLAKISCLVVNLWLSFPYFMIISLGALQSIDASMYEAADVDGATKFQQFASITLPLLLIALGPMLVGSFAFAFNNFGGIYLLTGGGPTMAAGVLPGHTDILISYTFKLAFGPQDKDYGLASSIAIIVFIIIGTLTFLNFKFTGTFKEVDNA